MFIWRKMYPSQLVTEYITACMSSSEVTFTFSLLSFPLTSLSLSLTSLSLPLSDCELVALLEDDTGMELLVCNKIVSLDLPVKEVFKKIWCANAGVSKSLLQSLPSSLHSFLISFLLP